MGTLNLKSLQKRALSACVLIPLVLYAVMNGGLVFYAMIALLACLSVYEAFFLAKKTDRFFVYGCVLGVYLFIGFLFCFLLVETHYVFPVLMLCMVWAADIGAYFTGKFFGVRKMAPTISPNKTWAGFVGAGVFAGLAGWLCLFIAGWLSLESSVLDYSKFFAFGLIVGWVGQAGDLFVSFIKRKAGVKDTGSLIPGHGGILDRIDSLLLVAPAFFALVFFMDIIHAF